jgi:hypothetical protein
MRHANLWPKPPHQRLAAVLLQQPGLDMFDKALCGKLQHRRRPPDAHEYAQLEAIWKKVPDPEEEPPDGKRKRTR